MTSFETHLPFGATASLLLLAAIATPTSSFAQRDLAADQLGAIAGQIAEVQTKGGPYSPELIDPLKTLSVLYQENGNYALASAVLDQAMQVIRANYGLRSLEQAPLLQQRIRSEETRGNSAAAWKLEQDLVALARRHPDDLSAAPILHEVGDKRMNLLDRYLAGERPPELVLGCFYEGPHRLQNQAGDGMANCTSGERQVAATAILMEAQRFYLQAINTFLRQRAYSSDELRELETKLVHDSYAYSGSYQIGRRSLRRLVSYDVANEAPLSQRIDSLIQVADWDLLFNERPAALTLYEQIHAYLEKQGAAQDSIDRLFSPETPYMLPTFAANPAAPSDTATGYVDLSFEVTRYGTTRRIDVVSSMNASKDARSDLVRLIARSRFRPIVQDGQFVRAASFVVRYYVEK